MMMMMMMMMIIIIIIIIIIIQLFILCAASTAKRPITDTTQTRITHRMRIKNILKNLQSQLQQ
jgi:heme/copper-type cytochrome/quinol oxidase subunit 2